MSSALVDSFSSDFDPSEFTDEYQEQLRTLIEAKLEKGEALDTQETFGEEAEDEGGKVLDLMEALRRSVEKNRGSKSASGNAKGSRKEAKDDHKEDKEEPARKPAAKSSGRKSRKGA